MSTLSKACLIMSLWTVLLSGCRLSDNPVTAEPDSPFSYLPDTLKELDDGWHAVDVIERDDHQHYQTYRWETDCQGLYHRSERLRFDQMHQQIGTEPADERVRTVMEGSGVDALEEAVCRRVRTDTASSRGSMDVAKAMKLAYGNFDEKNNQSRIQNICVDNHAFFKDCRAFSEGRVTPVFFLPTNADGAEHYILLIRTESLSGRLPPYLSAMQLAKVEGRWRYLHSIPYLPMTLSEQADALETTSIQLGKTRSGILMIHDVSSEAQLATDANILAINDQHQLAIVFSRTLMANNEAVCKALDSEVCWAYETIMTLDQNDFGQWWDIILTQKGHVLKGNRLIELPEKERFMMGKAGYYVSYRTP